MSKTVRMGTLRLFTKPVSYQWSTPDGSVHHASSVVLAPTRAGLKTALRKFWHQNTHVAPALPERD